MNEGGEKGEKESENCHICIFGFCVVWPKIYRRMIQDLYFISDL